MIGNKPKDVLFDNIEDVLERATSIYVTTYQDLNKRNRYDNGNIRNQDDLLLITVDHALSLIDAALDTHSEALNNGKQPPSIKTKPISKYKKITKSTLIECKALRDSGKSWKEIVALLGQYDPKLLQTKGMAFIAKLSVWAIHLW